MTARERRLMSDYEQVKKDFAGHKNIIVTPVGDIPPEKYHVTYFVNGIYLLPDGKIETLGRHEVDIILHADYPRYKPICKISTPIWHPNFRDGQICIGDIWGAGESLSDIIINIGDMIQYKSWNSSSPLSADAAKWAIENKHLFPVGNIDLYIADYGSAKDEVEIDLFDENNNVIKDEEKEESNDNSNTPTDNNKNTTDNAPSILPVKQENENDFEITAEELAGINFIPTAQRMQTASQVHTQAKGKVNIKTIFVKGLLWALIGAIVAFGISELTRSLTSTASAANLIGYSYLSSYLDNYDKAIDNQDSNTSLAKEYYDQCVTDMANSLQYEFNNDQDAMTDGIKSATRVSTAMWSAVIALFIGLSLGVGEGVFYGSKEKAIKYGAIGAGISIVIGFISGYLAQWLYASALGDNASEFTSALVRGLGWSVMGIGIGLAVGLIKPEAKRIIYCALGGFIGAFIGGFLFNFICDIIPNDTIARGVAIVIMGLLIGFGVGLLEQFAKQAWLKVIRGEFEGKEYLVFAGVTSIGNNGKNTIVLFKDKLVGPHHCDIILDGNKYVLVDCGTPMGTVVNGMRINRHILRQGDAIAVGNSVLVFNTK